MRQPAGVWEVSLAAEALKETRCTASGFGSLFYISMKYGRKFDNIGKDLDDSVLTKG